MLSLLKTKRTKTIITILLCIFSLFCLSTIAYSAFSATMNITGLAHSRIEADVRITDFSLHEVVNATSKYEEFSKDTISSQIEFKENAYVTYKIKVINYGNTNVGIYDITGFPENITYEIIDYKLQDEICNINGKCNNYAEKEFYIKIVGSNIETLITLTFDFRVFHNIKYTNFLNSYTEKVLSGSNLVLDLSNEEIQFIEIKANEQINYNYNNKTLTVQNIICDIEIVGIKQAIYTFEYTDSYQTFTVPYDGIYKIELWGAQGGGTSSYPGGNGGYTAGELSLNKGETFYVYVGETGQTSAKIVFNNGWKTAYFYSGTYAGGGATDLRLISGHWSDFESLKSRIMVAAGGGGAITYHSQLPGGAAGGLTGYNGGVYCSYAPASGTTSTGGTQYQGGSNGLGDHIATYTGNNINLFGNITYFYYSGNLNGKELSFNNINDTQYQLLVNKVKFWNTFKNNLTNKDYSQNIFYSKLSIHEKIILLILCIDPNLKLLQIYQDECTINKLKERCLNEYGFYCKDLFRLEELYRERFCNSLTIDKWQKRK